MAGSFDFYVDEDLLKQLFGNDDKPDKKPAKTERGRKAKASSTEQAEPARTPQAEPVGDNAEPTEAKAEPVEAKAQPIQVEAEPIQAEAEPVVAEPEPVQLEAEAASVEAEPAVAAPVPAEAEADKTVAKAEANEAVTNAEAIESTPLEAETSAPPAVDEVAQVESVAEAEPAQEAVPEAPQQEAVSDQPRTEAPAPVVQQVVNAAWQHADQLFESGDYETAAQQYLEAAQSGNEAESATLFYNAGVCWAAAQNAEKALQAFEQSLERAPESRAARLALGAVQLDLGRADAALKTFLFIYQPGSPEPPTNEDLDALQGQIRAALHLQQWEDAAVAAASLLKVDAANQSALLALLRVEIEQQNDTAAEAAAKEIIERDPDSRDALYALMTFAAKRGDAGPAASYCDAWLATGDAGSADEWLKVAFIFSEANQTAKAKDAYSKVLEADANNAAAAWNLSLLEEQDGNLDRALELLSVTPAPGTDAEWRMRQADLQLNLNRPSDAAANLQACVELRNPWPEAMFRLGATLHQLGQSEEAQEIMLEALRHKPQEAEWIEVLEAIAIERNDPIVALDCHERLVALQAGTPELSYNVGVMLQLESEPELAAKCYIHALEQKPDFGEALLNLGHALNALGREDEAKACWSKAIALNPAFAAGYFA